MNLNYQNTERHFPTLRDAPYRPRTRRRSAADTRAAAIAFAAAREILG
ncbi:MAG TPA: hypothetical protein VLG14_16720 [Sphingomonas sp.]|nr:hypothetical protein [Sphingomonas sp.]